ncbi:uncharacterized protein [Bemisia tabaci]|uniref:uncharacterized protein n=1 Tax=Bemisia tabaci TaxID=7038 RepID=UPI003B28A575
MKPIYKTCFVPKCKNTSVSAPEKLFFSVPQGPVRHSWCAMARRDKISLVSAVQCCEDHFEPSEDVEEWTRYCFLKERGLPTFNLRIKKGVLPHIFNCQPDRKRAHSTPLRSVVEKRIAAETKRIALQPVSDRNNNNNNKENHNPLITYRPRLSVYDSNFFMSWAHDSVSSHYESDIDAITLDTEISSFVDGAANENTNIERGHSFSASSHSTAENSTPTTSEVTCPTCKQRESAGTRDIATSPLHFECTRDTATSPVDFAGAIDEEEILSSCSEVETSYVSEAASDSTYNPEESVNQCTEEEDSAEEDNVMEDFTTEYTKDLFLKLATFRMERNPKQYLGLHPENLELLTHIEQIANISKIESYIVLRKIRTDESFFFIADDLGFSISKVSRIFAKHLPTLSAYFQIFVYWPEKRNILMTLPISFRANYKDVVSIIDCFEIELEKPSNALNQSQAWSEYKKGNTAKYLLSCTPNGFINFVSQGFGGRASDVTILKESDYLKILPPNSVVMADRGFKEVESVLALHNCRLVRPPSVSEGVPMTQKEALLTKIIASLRIHVERVIKQVRETAFVDAHARFNHNFTSQLDNVVNLVCALSNLQKPLVK